jgi:hypothetical protein
MGLSIGEPRWCEKVFRNSNRMFFITLKYVRIQQDFQFFFRNEKVEKCYNTKTGADSDVIGKK